MTTDLAPSFVRLAWIEAYLGHFDLEPASAVLGALGVDPGSLANVRAQWREETHAARTRGDFELSRRFASALARARVAMMQHRLSLAEIALRVAICTQDERALPNVALPLSSLPLP